MSSSKVRTFSFSVKFLLTLHAGLAQAESEEKSTNIRWGIRRSTLHPDSPAFSRKCFEYDRDDEGNLVININDAEVVGKVLVLYEQGWSFLKIKKELEALKVPTPTVKKKWPVKMIGNILTNEKYTGNSVYGETVADEFPATRRIRGISTEVHRSTNHHLVIIDE